jgi:hypothetical protein
LSGHDTAVATSQISEYFENYIKAMSQTFDNLVTILLIKRRLKGGNSASHPDRAGPMGKTKGRSPV